MEPIEVKPTLNLLSQRLVRALRMPFRARHTEYMRRDSWLEYHSETNSRGSSRYTIQSHEYYTPPKLRLIIHHQFPGVELVSPIYAGYGSSCYLPPDQKVDFGFTTQAGFNIGSSRRGSVGALLYKLQRKNNDQSSEKAVSSEEEATCIQLAVIWKVGYLGRSYLFPHLIEHDKGHVWDIQYALTEETWLMRDHTALMARVNTTCKEGYYELKMIISEGSTKDDTWRPWYIDMNE
jgi:hypothetical protein